MKTEDEASVRVAVRTLHYTTRRCVRPISSAARDLVETSWRRSGWSGTASSHPRAVTTARRGGQRGCGWSGRVGACRGVSAPAAPACPDGLAQGYRHALAYVERASEHRRRSVPLRAYLVCTVSEARVSPAVCGPLFFAKRLPVVAKSTPHLPPESWASFTRRVGCSHGAGPGRCSRRAHRYPRPCCRSV